MGYVKKADQERKERWEKIKATKTPEELEVFDSLNEITARLISTRDEVKDIITALQDKIHKLMGGAQPTDVGMSLDQAFSAYTNLIKSIGDVDRSMTTLVSEKVKAMKEHYARLRLDKGDDEFNLDDFDITEAINGK